MTMPSVSQVEKFMTLRKGDTITVKLKIVEFETDSTDPHLLIAKTDTGDRCFVRPVDIEGVQNYAVKPGDCVDYRNTDGLDTWGVVGPKVGNYHSVFRYNEQDNPPQFISRVHGRKPLPEGYEWPRKVKP